MYQTYLTVSNYYAAVIMGLVIALSPVQASNDFSNNNNEVTAPEEGLTFADFARLDEDFVTAAKNYKKAFNRPIALNGDGSLLAYFDALASRILFTSTGQVQGVSVPAPFALDVPPNFRVDNLLWTYQPDHLLVAFTSPADSDSSDKKNKSEPIDEQLHLINMVSGRQITLGQGEQGAELVHFSPQRPHQLLFQTTAPVKLELPPYPDFTVGLPSEQQVVFGSHCTAVHAAYLKYRTTVPKSKVWQYDMQTEETKCLLALDEGWCTFVVDDAFQIHAVVQDTLVPIQKRESLRILAPSEFSPTQWEEVFSANGKKGELSYGTHARDFKSVYVIDGRRGESLLKQVFLSDGSVKTIGKHPRMKGIMPNVIDAAGEGPDILGYVTNTTMPRFHLYDDAHAGLHKLLALFNQALQGSPNVIPSGITGSMSLDRKLLALPYPVPGNYTLFSMPSFEEVRDINIGDGNNTYAPFTKLVSEICPVTPGSVKSADGLDICYYLTNPGQGQAPHPTIVEVHGGPAARDKYRYDPTCQSLANCLNVAILQINFRGSTGLGKRLQYAGEGGQWDKILDDILLVTDSLIQNGIIDPERLFISGTSFGAWAVYGMLAFHPGKYKAGFAWNGDVDLIEAIKSETTPDGREYWQRLMGGNPDIPVDAQRLRALSPLHYAGRIDVPLMCIACENDTVVHAKQTQMMAEKLQRLKTSPAVSYVLIKGEGHAPEKVENIRALLALQHGFFAQQLNRPVDPAVTKVIDDAKDVVAVCGAEHLNFFPAKIEVGKDEVE